MTRPLLDGRLRRDQSQPRTDRLQKKVMRLGRDILDRGRVRQHRPGAALDLAFAGNLRQVMSRRMSAAQAWAC